LLTASGYPSCNLETLNAIISERCFPENGFAVNTIPGNYNSYSFCFLLLIKEAIILSLNEGFVFSMKFRFLKTKKPFFYHIEKSLSFFI